MTTNTLTSPERPTFGVEVEFVIATLRTDAVDPDADVEGLPPVLRVPNTFDGGGDIYLHEYTVGKVRELLQECFGSELVVNPKSVMDHYRDWGVGQDESVHAKNIRPYIFVSVEVSSPVQFSSPKGFDAISLAISTITSKFRCLVNFSCGLHVHVGLGAERLSLEQIRRIGSLSYAAESLLFTLHDPIRRVTQYCRPLQDYSRLADNLEQQDLEIEIPHANEEFKFGLSGRNECYRYLGRDRRHGEAPMSARDERVDEAHIEAFLETRQSGHFEPFTEPGDPRHTKLLLPDVCDELASRISAVRLASSTTPPAEQARQRNIPRLRLPKFKSTELLSMRSKIRLWGLAVPEETILDLEKRGPVPSVFEATERIYSQLASDYVSELLSGFDRPAISLASYECLALTSERVLRTIEFRLGEGSLDSEWISTWAKICVGFFKFALYSSPGQFIDVLTNCDRAMKDDGSYDVIDLLDDIGLFAEAEIAERRLTANKDRWNLTFVESESS
ncbi:putative amidoligase enzyme-domain-containing protein [Xylaria sp. FL1777]|nr:putative amidoligase enzyme-domain-containing protein [Xylaria sp. FL1777]